MNAGALLSSIFFPLLSTKLAPTIKLLVVMQIIDLLKCALGKDPKCLAAAEETDIGEDFTPQATEVNFLNSFRNFRP